MSNKNDRWSALSLKDRADLMNVYITNGISELKEMKKHYNSFGPGGFMSPINPSIIEEQLVKKPLRNAAYRFGSDEEVQQKGYASIYDLLRIMNPLYKSTNSMDDNKTMFLYGNVNGLPPANNSNGKDFSEYIKSTYPTKDVKPYQGVINPFDEYVIDNRDKGLIEELAKKGKDLYINADTEYVNMSPDDFKYRDDVASYNAQFVNTNNGPAISAADLYDFGPDYNPAKYNEDLSKTDSFLGNLESKLLSYVGTPYILRQDNIPIRFIDYNNASSKDIDRSNMLKAAITHGMLSKKDVEKGIDLDSKLAEILGNGYIEPSVVTAETKKANGGRILSGEEDTKSFWQKLLESGQSARDARLGAIGAQQVRDLYSEGKTEEAQKLAQQYAKANTAGISLAAGSISPSLLGDLAITGTTTLADSLIEGDTKNLGKNFATNALGDIVGGAFQYVPKLYKWTKNKANDILNINTFDDAINSAVEFYKRNFNPNVKVSDFGIVEVDDLPEYVDGEYVLGSRWIRIGEDKKHIHQRGTIGHEIRHHEDADLNAPNEFGTFTIEDDAVYGRDYGRQKLTEEEKQILKKAYGETKMTDEHPAINVDFKEFLERMYIKENGKIPSVDELNIYIENLPYQLLSFARGVASYSTPWSMLKTSLFPNNVKKALTNVKKYGGKLLTKNKK